MTKHIICGTVAILGALFPLAGARAYTETVLYKFTGGADGSQPTGALVADASGALYGTTTEGGNFNTSGGCGNGCGTVFKLTPPAAGQGAWTETVLYSFKNYPDGIFPTSLIKGPGGVLYGTTAGGGVGGGIAFKLTPPPVGEATWTKQTLHEFGNVAYDGGSPFASLTMDKMGTLYGTTQEGGGFQLGTVFKLTPPSSGGTSWHETILYNFSGGSADGASPLNPVILDASGNVYGTTSDGGSANAGTVYELTPPPKGTGTSLWTGHVLYSLSRRPNGAYPQGGLIAYERSVLIGTTLQGGANCSHYYNGGCGTIFKMTSSGGAWTGHLVYKFTGGADGTDPEGSLIADATGDLYGTTANGGAACPAISAHGCGVVFKLTPSNARKTSFAESLLYAFQGGAADGANPQAALTIGATGALYGTTFAGGGSGCYGPGCGTVFKLTP